jgi:hypothetical protein
VARGVVRDTDSDAAVPAPATPAARTAQTAARGAPALTQGWWLVQPAEENSQPVVRGQNSGGTARETPPASRSALDSLVRIRERRLERAEKLRDHVRKANGRTEEAGERGEANSGLARMPNGAPVGPLTAPTVEFAGARNPMLPSPANSTGPVASTSASGPEIVIDLPDDLTAPPPKPNKSRGLFGGSRN